MKFIILLHATLVWNTEFKKEEEEEEEEDEEEEEEED